MKTKKLFLSIMLSVVMVLGLMSGMSMTAEAVDYVVVIGNEGIVTFNQDASGTNWTFNASTLTLTLDGCTIDIGNKDYGIRTIYGGTRFNIELKGSNKVKGNVYGIYTRPNDDITITGDGTLEVEGGTAGIFIDNSKLTIESGTVIAKGTNDVGIKFNNNGTLNNNIAGMCWSNVEGTEGKTVIDAGTQTSLAYKKVQFPTPVAKATAPTAKTLTANGSAQELVTAGTAEGGTMQYALGTDASNAPTNGWNTSIPTGTDAGTYYVWYKAVGDNAHVDSDASCVTVTIAKKSDEGGSGESGSSSGTTTSTTTPTSTTPTSTTPTSTTPTSTQNTTTKVTAPKTADTMPFVAIAVVFVGLSVASITFVATRKNK